MERKRSRDDDGFKDLMRHIQKNIRETLKQHIKDGTLFQRRSKNNGIRIPCEPHYKPKRFEVEIICPS